MHDHISAILTNLALSQKDISAAEHRYLYDDAMVGLVYFLVKKATSTYPRSLMVVTTKASIARKFCCTVGWINRRLELLQQLDVIREIRTLKQNTYQYYQYTSITISGDLIKELFAEKPGNQVWNDYARDLFESLKI